MWEYLEQLRNRPDGIYEDVIPGVAFEKRGSLVQGNYTRDVMYNAGWNEDTCFWRGSIYDFNLNRLVARGFEKFFNLGEHPSSTPEALNTLVEDSKIVRGVTISEKIDGTMVLVFRHPTDKQIHVATRGALVPVESSNYPNYHARAIEILKTKYPTFYAEAETGKTYIFELIYKDGRQNLVTQYEEDDMILIGILENDLTFDYNFTYLKLFSDKFSLKMYSLMLQGPTTLSVPNWLKRCEDWAKSHTDAKVTEGVVFCLTTEQTVLRRVKIKTEQYKVIHRLMSETGYDDLFELIQSGAHWELLKNTPKQLHARIIEVYQKFYYTLNEALRLYSAVCNIQEQKDFALKVEATIPLNFRKYMYALRNGNNIYQYVKPHEVKPKPILDRIKK